jgi:hypothetical protein
MEKHPAWAAPINSSGFVPSPSWKREANEYEPDRAPVSVETVP